MRNSYKSAYDWHAKFRAFAGKEKAICRQRTRNCWPKHPELQANTPAIAGKNTRSYRHNCYHTERKFTFKVQVSVHSAGEVTCNLRALIRAVACILQEVLSTYKELKFWCSSSRRVNKLDFRTFKEQQHVHSSI